MEELEDSYEQEIFGKIDGKQPLPSKLDYNVFSYFWQLNPILSSTKKNIPRFLRSIEVFESFTDGELRKLSHYMHVRL